MIISRWCYCTSVACKNAFKENLLLCYSLTEICTSKDIFNITQGYFNQHEINWQNCCGVCADGCKSMSGCYKGLRGRIKDVVHYVFWNYCAFHRQILALNLLPHLLKEVLDQLVKVVNVVKENKL